MHKNKRQKGKHMVFLSNMIITVISFPVLTFIRFHNMLLYFIQKIVLKAFEGKQIKWVWLVKRITLRNNNVFSCTMLLLRIQIHPLKLLSRATGLEFFRCLLWKINRNNSLRARSHVQLKKKNCNYHAR